MKVRTIVEIYKKAAVNQKITAKVITNNGLIELQKGTKRKYIIGYTLPINDAATYKILREKNLCSDLLSFKGIKNVPHRLLVHPVIELKKKYCDGNYNKISSFIRKYNFPIVIKKYDSSKGEGVYLAKNYSELEFVITKLFQSENYICLCPFRKIKAEYRAIVYNNNCLLCYEKIIPHIEGNGEKNSIELIAEYLNDINFTIWDYYCNLKHRDFIAPNKILKKKEKLRLHWKYNNNKGYTYKETNNSSIIDLAVKAANTINAKFVSVDIINSLNHGFEILEINATVILDSFASLSKNNYKKAIYIYESVLKDMFQF